MDLNSLPALFLSRSLCSGGCREGGEPEAEVREPGSGPVHREPHVSLECVSDHRHQEQTEIKRTERRVPSQRIARPLTQRPVCTNVQAFTCIPMLSSEFICSVKTFHSLPLRSLPYHPGRLWIMLVQRDVLSACGPISTALMRISFSVTRLIK